MRTAALLRAALAAATFSWLLHADANERLGQAQMVVPAACTPEMQRCLDKLAAWLERTPVSADSVGLPARTFDLIEVDPACALLLGTERIWAHQPRGGLR